MKKIAFIGLGTMGKPMAANLLNKGFAVTVYNRSSEKAVELVQLGATVASTPAEAAKGVDVVITMLSNDAAVLEAVLGNTGVIQEIKAGQTVIDCSTVSPETSLQIHAAMSERAVEFLDAPVTGSKPQAEAGILAFMVGGSYAATENMRPVFEAMGTKIIHLGPSGSGAYAKLANNTMVAINALSLIEGLSIVTKAGIDAEQFLQIVKSGGANSRITEMKSDKILNRDFSTQFSLQLMLKDLLLASQVSSNFQLPSPMLKAATGVFQMGLSRGFGEDDLSAIVQCYEEWMNAQVGQKISGAERRRNTRVHLDIPLHLSVHQWEQEGSFTGQTIEGSLYDLSESGIQIVSSFPLAQDMFIVIHFPQEADLPPVTARVIRIENDNDKFRYGCMLSGLAPYVRLKIEEYLASQL
ncbi:NAD-binding protein [Paenibacillus sp. LMG 31456]|uniref:NAD-binding protein n=1 Tax=Paenibacillus foliorum TaxID=2654974 RepID=A0A972GSF5_9BACL|nr:NAD(P)-binding domain-containing protein [Paenibacillus foliorum]NOU93002.1 NAD-binding protein [Paenibacillus foliorum]